MIDTHCHLYDEAFDNDRSQAVSRALDAGVSLMLLPAIDSHSHDRQEALANTYPGHFRQMMGLHPTSVTADFEPELDLVQKKLFAQDIPDAAGPRYVAVGEIGLDLYWDKSYLEQQLHVLRQQILWAQQTDLPVCLHVRKAHNELFNLLRDLNLPRYKGVMHCFGGSVQEAHKAVEMGFHIGIGGVVTFKNATLAEVARAVPLDRILLETDAPYLAPVPHRGQRNESAYIPLIAQCIATLRGITFQQVAETTTLAARQLFAL
ncbi:MAG: TatD family hydrolase [Bacteroidales bacterium]|nr:TatD family hydrolase [Bacteroidales bacterium]